MSNEKGGTPSSRWLEAGEPDPHGDRYACERSRLEGGQYTDDEVANGQHTNPLYFSTIARDRLHWLSRRLEDEITRREALEGVLRGLASHFGVDLSDRIAPEEADRRLREAMDLRVRPMERDARRYWYLRRHGCVPIGADGAEVPMAGTDLDRRVDAVFAVPDDASAGEHAKETAETTLLGMIARLEGGSKATSADVQFLKGLLSDLSTFQTLFQTRMEDDMRAIAAWRAEHGDESPFPKHIDLVAWLVRRMEPPRT